VWQNEEWDDDLYKGSKIKEKEVKKKKLEGPMKVSAEGKGRKAVAELLRQTRH